MKKRIVIANWKLYVDSPKAAAKFLDGLRKTARTCKGVEAWIAAPFPFVSALKNQTIKIGAQTVSVYENGAHTGEVSATMLKNIGAKFVIVGHSERREFESNEVVREQLSRALGAGLTAVLCAGEREREASGAHFTYIEEQIRSACLSLPHPSRLVVAYEPVSAIGKSAEDAMRPAELREMAIFVKKVLSDALGRAAAERVPILYGGSVEPSNAKELMEEGGVAGFLVGHASAELDSFVEILKALRRTRSK